MFNFTVGNPIIDNNIITNAMQGSTDEFLNRMECAQVFNKSPNKPNLVERMNQRIMFKIGTENLK